MRMTLLATTALIGLAGCYEAAGRANNLMPAGSEWAILSIEGKDRSQSNRHYIAISDGFVSYSGGCNITTYAPFPALGPDFSSDRSAASTLMGCLQENDDRLIGQLLEKVDSITEGQSDDTVILGAQGKTLMELRRKPLKEN